MKLGIVVGTVKGLRPEQTTVHLAMQAAARGHEVWFIGVTTFALASDGRVLARARSVSRSNYRAAKAFVTDLHGSSAKKEQVDADSLDVLLLRINPTNTGQEPWMSRSAMMFAQAAARRGTLVLNDPTGLAQALDKLYFHMFPEAVVPESLITRNVKEIREFAKRKGRCVLKPLAGSGGQGVFLVRDPSSDNLNQMVEAISRDGFVIVQEYLPAAEVGDLRMFLLNGRPLKHKGRYASVRRTRPAGDIRSNVHSGGKPARGGITEAELRIAEIVRPKLVRDGMFLVGLDIVGDKLVEINVFTPGGLLDAKRFESQNFFEPLIDSLERKVDYARWYGRDFKNSELAVL